MFKIPSDLRADRSARYAAKASLSPSKPFRPQNPQAGNSKSQSQNNKANRIWNLIFLKGYIKERLCLKVKQIQAVCQVLSNRTEWSRNLRRLGLYGFFFAWRLGPVGEGYDRPGGQ